MTVDVWKDIPGFEDYYRVSNQGRVRSLDRVVPRMGKRWRGRGLSVRGQLLNPTDDGGGYLFVGLRKGGRERSLKVHKLVWLAFYGPCPPEMQVDHVNGNKYDNRLANLRPATNSESQKQPLLSQQKELSSTLAMNSDD